MSITEKYPLTEKKVTYREPIYERWQYTLSGWLFLIRTQATEEGAVMERQILDRMWEDLEFNNKIRKEFDDWVAEEPEQDWRMEAIEDDVRLSKRKSIRYGGKFKGRGHGEKRREP